MGLDLVHGGRDLRRLEQRLRRLDGEVADSNTADFTSLDKLLQHSPRISDRDIGNAESLRHRVDWGEGFVGMLESDRPVDL
jgi:hypothetical protein